MHIFLHFFPNFSISGAFQGLVIHMIVILQITEIPKHANESASIWPLSFSNLVIGRGWGLDGFCIFFFFHMNIHLLYDCPHLHDFVIVVLCSGTYPVVKNASLEIWLLYLLLFDY